MGKFLDATNAAANTKRFSDLTARDIEEFVYAMKDAAGDYADSQKIAALSADGFSVYDALARAIETEWTQARLARVAGKVRSDAIERALV